MAQHSVVAAGHDLTAQAAESVLRAGGNAFDGAVAAMAAACVAEPVLVSLAGGGFLLAQASRENFSRRLSACRAQSVHVSDGFGPGTGFLGDEK